MEREFIESILKNWVILSIGCKGSGKSFLLLKFLKFAIEHDIYDRYILVLPMFTMEQNDSYDFLNPNDEKFYIFESYNEVITKELLRKQESNKDKKMKCFFAIDDASGEQVFKIDDSLRHMITSIRHYNISLWMILHACSGILSPFIRQNCDILFLSKIVNHKLLRNIYEEFLSLLGEYYGRDGENKFVSDVIKLHRKQYQVLYINIRTGSLDYNVGNWDFDNLK